MELKICVVGCGMIGREHIERIQNRIRGAKVVARALRDFICDPRREVEVNQPWALEPATSSPADSLLSMEESLGPIF